jgi:C-terminal processing protease CtpA/Prc
LLRSLLLLLTSVLVTAHVPAATASDSTDESFAPILNFEAGHTGDFPTGWRGGDRRTIHVDSSIVHSGKAAARIERTAITEDKFSTLTNSVPVNFGGSRVELRGWVRVDSVSEGAGLWMRQDGPRGMLEFDNMADRRLRGTSDWAEYTISLPLNPAARELFFGFLLAGDGTAWVDDLQLLVDGKPVWQAPRTERSETALDRDHEFDAGSNIALDTLTPGQIENLATLCRVWGFLKYRHPKITSGELHWDFELLRILPKILAAGGRSEANAALLEWIERLGVPPALSLREPRSSEVQLEPDLLWLDDERALGVALSTALKSIHAHRPSGGAQFYISLTPGVGNPVFSNERDYSDIAFPDTGYQLLGLFRYWNIIQYWYPYRNLLDDNWDTILEEFIPRLGLPSNSDAYALELMVLIARVHDTHANLWSSLHLRPPVGDGQLPIAIRFIQAVPVVVQTIAFSGEPKNLFQRGDVLTHIAGIPVAKLVAQWSPYYAASNEPTRLRDIAQSMSRGPTGPVTVRVQRAAVSLDLNVDRIPTSFLQQTTKFHDLPGPAFRLLSSDVAYLKLSSVNTGEIVQYVREATGTKGWIIDLRNYPAQFVVFSLGSQFVDHTIDFARFTNADLSEPGRFVFTAMAPLSPPRVPRTAAPNLTPSVNLNGATFADRPDYPSTITKPVEWSPPNEARYGGKLVLLVDEMTQSQAEYTAMALRATPRAIVVGSTTAGSDGDVSSIPLPGGLRTMISGIGIFYPDKRPTQRVGIVPDIEVKPTLAGIRAGRDEVLEAALREVLGPRAAVEEVVQRAQRIEN